MGDGRILINFQRLPTRARTLDREQVDADIREAIAVAREKLEKRAAVHRVNGWTDDLDYGENGFEFGVEQHTVIGRLRMVRS